LFAEKDMKDYEGNSSQDLLPRHGINGGQRSGRSGTSGSGFHVFHRVEVCVESICAVFLALAARAVASSPSGSNAFCPATAGNGKRRTRLHGRHSGGSDERDSNEGPAGTGCFRGHNAARDPPNLASLPGKLIQVDARIPAGAPSGPAVSLELGVGDVLSPPTTLAIQ
jgi:hypothetical protein